MILLLDTHVAVWLTVEPDRLSRPADSAIRRARSTGGLAISSLTLWEAAFLVRRGSIRTAVSPEQFLREMLENAHLIVKDLTATIAALATEFPDDYPKDPLDRIIGATARAENLPLVTRDEKIRASSLIKTIW